MPAVMKWVRRAYLTVGAAAGAGLILLANKIGATNPQAAILAGGTGAIVILFAMATVAILGLRPSGLS
jgi:hypothetical protein